MTNGSERGTCSFFIEEALLILPVNSAPGARFPRAIREPPRRFMPAGSRVFVPITIGLKTTMSFNRAIEEKGVLLKLKAYKF
jgi:hypothetical protein